MFNASRAFTEKEVIIGFDLGTTNSVISFYNKAIPEIIPISGSLIIPSFVEFTPDKQVKAIGLEARDNRTSPLRGCLKSQKTVKTIIKR
jgi:molecular chaperone DnaK (HSP70)